MSLAVDRPKTNRNRQKKILDMGDSKSATVVAAEVSVVEVWWEPSEDEDPQNPQNWPDWSKWLNIITISSISFIM